ncbi:MAG: HAD family phosphatase [Nitrospirae bacterium]|nr:HAD family phosphatase [Nitrospirota bacterium]
MIKATIFDFGGVLAEEGFKQGISAIAIQNRLDQDKLFNISEKLIYDSGYVAGTSGEADYWTAFRKQTGITNTDTELRETVLAAFALRPAMLRHVERIKSLGFITAILSDQTNWLDEIDQRTPFFYLFDHVYNSFHIKKSKREPSLFREVCSMLNVKPEEALFVDDNAGNIQRASAEGLKTIHFTGIESFGKEIVKFIA